MRISEVGEISSGICNIIIMTVLEQLRKYLVAFNGEEFEPWLGTISKHCRMTITATIALCLCSVRAHGSGLAV